MSITAMQNTINTDYKNTSINSPIYGTEYVIKHQQLRINHGSNFTQIHRSQNTSVRSS